MKTRYPFSSWLFVCFCLLAASSLSAQSGKPAPAAAASSTPALSPETLPAAPPKPENLTLAQITEQAQNTSRLSSQVLQIASPLEEIEKLQDLLPQTQAQALKLKTDSNSLLENSQAGVEQIRTAQTQWQFLREQIDKPLKQIRTRNEAVELALGQVKSEEDKWKQFKAQISSVAVPAEAEKNYQKALADLSDARKQLTATLKVTLSQADQWQALMDSTDATSLLLQQKEKDLRSDLLSSLQPPLWELNKEEFLLNGSAHQSFVQQWTLVGQYLIQLPDRAALLVGAIIAMLVFLLQLRSRPDYARPLKDGANLRFALVDRPYSTTIAISVALALMVLYPNAPTPLPSALTLMLFIPIVRLGLPQLTSQLRPLVWLVSLLFVLTRVVTAIEAMPAIQRLWLMFCAILVIGTCFYGLIKLRESIDRNSLGWKALRAVLWLCLLSALIALIGSVVGLVQLAQFLMAGVSNSTYVAVCLAVITGITGDLVAAVLYLPITARSRIITRYRLLVAYYLRRGVALLGILFWIAVVLKQFLLADMIWNDLTAIFSHDLRWGNLAISLGDVLAVSFTLWFSFKLSYVIRYIFLEDIAPHTQMERGVPVAVATLMHYAIVLIGFLLAIGAAGVDMSKIAIMAGALGVGIGIGLQDVVNNFTSGLILLFEHNIKQDDVIQTSGVTGRVVTIGLRASIVKTFDGAEVIVPNGQLASSQVINWTQSDQERRITIPVGVAYGTDPEQVISTLLDIANNNSDVLQNPPSTAFFLRFGDSSIDFELRAWVSSTDVVSDVTSSLCVKISQVFAAKGIGMPFPQRDIYIHALPDILAGKQREKAPV